jgi:hypothetical protein
MAGTETRPAPEQTRENARLVLGCDGDIAIEKLILYVFVTIGPAMSLCCDRDDGGLVLVWDDGTAEEVSCPRIEAWLRRAMEVRR